MNEVEISLLKVLTLITSINKSHQIRFNSFIMTIKRQYTHHAILRFNSSAMVYRELKCLFNYANIY